MLSIANSFWICPHILFIFFIHKGMIFKHIKSHLVTKREKDILDNEISKYLFNNVILGNG